MEFKKTLSILFLLVFFCCSVSEKAICILPKNYVGYVIIIYNQEDGDNTKYLDNKRVYIIPQSGILKTQFSIDYGLSMLPEFYYESVNPDNKLPLVIDWEDYSENQVNVSIMSTGKSFKNFDNSTVIEYTTFLVGTKNQIKNSSIELNKIHIADLIDD